MHLKRIELTNYRQHRKMDVDFEGNLIAILGKNGSGKSNLIGAIQFALTGEQPGFTKSDLTTWGEKEGSVKLTFTAGSANEEFVIVRKTNGDVTLKVGGETVKQARKVEDALRDKAGLDKELIRQIVFVPQKGIDAILFDDPKNREVAFQRLIGIGNASKIYEALGREITALDKPQGFDEAIARSRQQLAEQNNLAKTCREALAKYEDAMKVLPSKESLEKEVDKCAGAQAAVEDYIAACNRITDAETLRDMADKRLEALGAPPDSDEELIARSMKLCHDADAGAALLAEGKEAVRYLTRLKELSSAAASAQEEFGNAEQKFQAIVDKYPTTLEDDKAEMDRLTAEENAAAAEARSLRNLAKEASSDGTCPVCGAPASQEDIAKHLEERLAAAEKKSAQAADLGRKARMDYDKRLAEEQMACQAVEKKRTAYDIALDALRKAHDANVEGCSVDMATFAVSYKGHTPDDIQAIEKRNSELTARIAELSKEVDAIKEEMVKNNKTRNAAKDARDYAARQAAQVDMARQSKEASAKRLSDLGIDPESVSNSEACRKVAAKARANLEAYNGILRDMAAEKGKLESIEATLENTKRLIDDLENKKELEEQVKDKVDTLKRVRDWFHYREGPRIMSQNVMRDLTACVNNYLDQFCAPFVVEATEEGFGFKCRFIDGRTMPEPLPDASMLSGGQKVALAIAFRLAVYMCFGGELGLLSLDEPTAYLDDASIGHLGEVLEQVRQVARNKGLQILMATHEPKIIPYLDGKIDLNEMKGE